MSRPAVLSVGTTHPWNVAGVGLDQLIGNEFEVRVLTVTTAVSAQDAGGVRGLYPLPAEAVRAQFASIPWDAIDAIRVGAVPTTEAIREVANALREHLETPAVVDPVFTATLGGKLADDGALPSFRDQLATLPNVILTPNVGEAALLLGTKELTRNDLPEAAGALLARGARAILITGGHLSGDPVDTLASAEGIDRYTDNRLPVDMRGTGCTLAMALACELARGMKLLDAVRSARAFVRAKIASAQRFAGIDVVY